MFIINEYGLVTIWSSAAERMFGWDETEIVGKSASCLADPADSASDFLARQSIIAHARSPFRNFCWRVRKDQTRFLADITIDYFKGDALLPAGFMVLVRDVKSDDSQALSLEASSILLSSIIDTVPHAMIVFDDHGIMLACSKVAMELFGYAKKELIGQNISMLKPPSERERHCNYLIKYWETGKTDVIGHNCRAVGQRKDGSIFPCTLRVREAFGGGQRFFIGFLYDLSEAERTETQLHELSSELSHILRISETGTLATTMAHELNQPLMAISNMLQTSTALLQRGADRQVIGQVATALEEAGKEALRAGAIVKRLRDFVLCGELELTIEDPKELISGTCLLVDSEMKLRGCRVSLNFDQSLGQVLVDRIQIEQVLLNLLRNALEASADEAVFSITARSLGATIEIRVEDSGPGVPPEKVYRLFTPFSTMKPGGMGMGLSICKMIVKAHGGEIWHEQAATGGALFVFTLPTHKKEDFDE